MQKSNKLGHYDRGAVINTYIEVRMTSRSLPKRILSHLQLLVISPHRYEEAEAELDPNSSERKNSKIANLTILCCAKVSY